MCQCKCVGFSCFNYTVFGQAGVESAHGVTVRMGVAEEDFEGVFAVNGLHNGFADENGLGLAYGNYTCED